MKTREYINGEWVTVDDAFRGYGDSSDSSQDYIALMNRDRYAPVLGAEDLPSAARAVQSSGYATDPNYAQKVLNLSPANEEQARFLEARRAELLAGGMDTIRAELGARQSALETGWGKHAPGNNYYGIKGKQKPRGVRMADGMLEVDIGGSGNRPDVRMAGVGAAGMVPGDPETGLADPPRGFTPQIDPRGLLGPPRGSQRHQQMATYPEDLEDLPTSRPKMDIGQLLMHLGAGIGSTPTGSGGTTQGVMKGIRAGMQDYAKTQAAEIAADQELYDLKMKRAEWKAKQQALRQREQDIQGLPVEMQAMARLDPTGLSGMMQGPRYGTGAPIQVQRDGKTYLVHTDDRGNTRETPLDGTPLQYDPNQRGAVAQSIAQGTASGKDMAQNIRDLPKAVEQATDALSTIDSLIQHPGRGMATGKSAMIPLIPGTEAYNYDAKLKRAQGQMFLTAFERLKGAGQITEIEGQKATEAIMNLDRAQTEEQHMAALIELRDIVSRGLMRAQSAPGVPPGAVGPATVAPAAPGGDGWSMKPRGTP